MEVRRGGTPFNVLEITFPAPDARYLLCCIRQRVAHSFMIEAGERGRRTDGAECRADTFRAAVSCGRVRAPSAAGSKRHIRA